jgi:hypothetical protein
MHYIYQVQNSAVGKTGVWNIRVKTALPLHELEDTQNPNDKEMH